ncbi:hypothetical protein BMS3Abin02_00075 [bacterium BMS3Abin02]|nr:hypothetical protein BMS3Abin02_00075 [bacterium BMS3Abin02]GBE21929.1 hypothetical protein BMS3Bbin01_01283 [bacterium BMS3Bbin01]HDH25361.1 hypothetical protein [Actinomycetota bacterium]
MRPAIYRIEGVHASIRSVPYPQIAHIGGQGLSKEEFGVLVVERRALLVTDETGATVPAPGHRLVAIDT